MKKSKRKLPLVSIVIPAYNGAAYIKQSIQSVLDQNYTNIELLVIDDGSTDETVEILKTYGDLCKTSPFEVCAYLADFCVGLNF